MVKMKIVIKVI